MFETTQPKVVETANQPDIAAGTEGEATETLESEPFLTVRYNKEDTALTEDAARMYAQKGMNYDKLSERLETANAKLTEYENSDLNGLERDFADESGGASKEASMVLAHRLNVEMDENAAKQTVIDGQLADFMQRNPGVDPRELPSDVLDAWRSGVPLGEAEAGYEASLQVRELQQHMREMQTNAENAMASMGRLQTNGNAHAKPLSVETIRNMSNKELEKNHERIWEFLTGEKRGK